MANLMKDGVYAIGLENLQSKFQKIPPGLFSKSLMEKIGVTGVAAIKLRTGKGLDLENKAFKPYSAGHKRARSKRGLPTGKVDLFFSGLMMNSMTHEVVDRRQVRLFFANTADERGVTSPAKAFFNDRSRKFFGLNEKDVKAIEKVVQNRLDELLSS